MTKMNLEDWRGLNVNEADAILCKIIKENSGKLYSLLARHAGEGFVVDASNDSNSDELHSALELDQYVMIDENETKALFEKFFEKAHLEVSEWLCLPIGRTITHFEIVCDHPIGKVIRTDGKIEETNSAILILARDIGDVTDVGFRAQAMLPTFHDGHWWVEKYPQHDPIEL